MKKSKTSQILLCCLANSALLGSGMSLGFTAVALPYMLMPDSTLPIDQDEASWIASLASIATPVGCLLSGDLLDRFGRRTTLLIISAPLTLGWLLIGLSPSLIQMYLGRISTGIGTGLCSIPATVYTAEVADSSIRGWLVTGTSVSIALGVVIVYILGALLKSQWQLVALICAVFPVLTTVLVFFFLPESPVWLVAKNRLDDASHSLMRINRATTPAQVNEELQALTDRAQKSQRRSLSLTTTLKALSRPEAWKPLVIMNIFFFFQQFTGTFVVIFYAVDVVQEAGIQTDPFLVTVLIGLTRLIFTFLASYLSKRFGRRPIAILSGVGMTLSLITLATHLYILPPYSPSVPDRSIFGNFSDVVNSTQAVNSTMLEAAESVSFLPVTMLLIYILASTIGFLTLPWSMIGEVFPAQVRGVASGLTTCTAYAISFLVLKMYPYMKEVLDKHGVFYFFGSMAFLGTLFVIFCLPETEGKTLQEIEMHFMNKGEYRLNPSDLVDFLGVRLDGGLSWTDQIEKIEKKISSGLFVLRRTSKLNPNLNLSKLVYHSLIESHITYSIVLWGGYKTHLDKIFVLQKKALRSIYGLPPWEHCGDLFVKADARRAAQQEEEEAVALQKSRKVTIVKSPQR